MTRNCVVHDQLMAGCKAGLPKTELHCKTEGKFCMPIQKASNFAQPNV